MSDIGRRLFSQFALILLLAASFTAGAQARTVITNREARLRAEPAVRAAIKAHVPARTSITITTCTDGWCAATWRGLNGWVARSSLDLTATPPPRAGRGYNNSDGVWVPSPQYSPNGPPAGASAQCNDGTYSFSTHRRGTCSHHGGVRRWL